MANDDKVDNGNRADPNVRHNASIRQRAHLRQGQQNGSRNAQPSCGAEIGCPVLAAAGIRALAVDFLLMSAALEDLREGDVDGQVNVGKKVNDIKKTLLLELCCSTKAGTNLHQTQFAGGEVNGAGADNVDVANNLRKIAMSDVEHGLLV